MKSPYHSLAVTTILVSTVLSAPAFAQTSPGQITEGPARFTVVSPTCIRLEYAPNNGFVDTATLFATNRAARDTKAKIKRTAGAVTIETAMLTLVYRPDGKPFSSTNLKVTFKNGKQAGSWVPGQKNAGNLGGPLRTLDFTNRALDLPDGLVSRDGWGIVDDSGRAIRKDGWIAARPGGGPPSEKDVEVKNEDLDWYLFVYGQNYPAALRALSTVSGAAALPRKPLLGSWNSRWAKMTSEDYRQVVREYEEHDFPLDVLVMDMEWHTQNATTGLKWSDNLGWTGYTWDKKLLPDPEGLLQEFKRKGVYTTLNDHPHDGIRDHEEMYPEFMKSLGLKPEKGNNLPFKAGDKKYFDAFWAASHAPHEKMGVDFWWLDWQQDSLVPWVSGVPGLRHLPWLNELYFQKTEEQGLRGQSYSRWGGWGDQRNPMQFSGDTSATWNELAFQIPFSTTSGNGGCFYWAHDTGGFFGSRNTEQYTRWTQFSGLSAALRVHSVGEDRRPWYWGKQAEDAMRLVYHTRSELFPYIYTSARQSFDETLPLLRPMYLQHPTEEVAYHVPAQYLYGDNIIVAPIVSPGVGPGFVAQQSVWFPQGTWFNFLTGEKYDGNQQVLVTGALDETPVYMRGGTPVPMQPYTQRMGSDPIKTLRVRVYPGANGQTGTSSLYEDDGRTPAYKKNGFARTPLAYTRNGNNIEVKVGGTTGKFNGQPATRAYSIELPATNAATGVKLRVDGVTKPLTAKYDAATQTNTIAIPEMPIGKAFSLTAVCAPADTTPMRQKALRHRVRGILGNEATASDTASIIALAEKAEPQQQQMLLATVGVGFIKNLEGPNFEHNPGRLTFFAPQSLIEGGKVKSTLWAQPSTDQTLKGGVLPLGAVTSPRTTPTLDFRIAGKPFQLPKTGANPLLVEANVALKAKITVSSTEGGYKQEALTDGAADGYPNNAAFEWSSNGQKAGASVRLDWTVPQTINRIVLFDRPNETDDITGGVLKFSDGSTIEVGALKNEGTEVKFPAKTVTWVVFEVTSAKPGTVNAGMSEFAVYKAD